MQPASAQGGGTDVARLLRRFGPIVLIVIVAVAVIVVVATSGGDSGDEAGNGTDTTGDDADGGDSGDSGDTGADDSDGGDDTGDPDGGDSDGDTGDPGDDPDDPDGPRLSVDGRPLRDGVVPLSWAIEQGIDGDIDWGPRCDVERGTIAVPDPYAVECMAPWEGDNGGATARGVTADSIKVVWWIPQEQDPILNYVTSAIVNDDTNAEYEHTIRGLIEMYETYYETYGRRVDLIVVEGSGTIVDVGAAVADARAIVEDHEPFMVWGGPNLTNAFAQELHANGVACIGCIVAQNYEYYEANDPLAWSVGKGAEQLDLLVAEYIGKRLAGDPAIHAGDDSMHDRERVFGRIWITTGEGSEIANERFEAHLAEWGVELAESQNYVLDPGTLQESAASVIAKMKQAGVTSVILSTDPVAPRDFTFEATAQEYFPEWIVTGSVLVDTTAFSRSYDQGQWAHAFGISNLATRVVREEAGIFSLYKWFHGEAPQADDTIGVIFPNPQTFYSFLQAVGPEVTMEGFREAFFNGVPSERALTASSLSWGAEGIWPTSLEPDYRGVDDISEIWWDPNEPGLDEIDTDGVGMWRWVDGGIRYKPGEIPEGPPKAFEMEGSVAIYPERPPQEQYPSDYSPLPAGG